jgi:glyoxylate/hydroxypyruvate reductase
MHKVLITRRIPKRGIELLQASKKLEIIQWNDVEPMPREKLFKTVKENPDLKGVLCMLTDGINKEFFEETKAQNLKVVSTMSVGFDHIDVKECRSRGIKLGYTPGVLTDTTSDLSIALLFATARRVQEGMAAARNGEWSTWKPEWLLGKDVTGATIGVFGMGRIGKNFAKKMHCGFGCKILYHDIVGEQPDAKEFNGQYVDFDTLLAESDFVVAHCALTPDLVGKFNLETFKKMKKDAIFINTTRGPLVNQDDLYTALSTGVIYAAGLDVTVPEPLPPNHKLYTLKNCTILPHMGSSTEKCRGDMAYLAAQNLLAGIEGTELAAEIP